MIISFGAVLNWEDSRGPLALLALGGEAQEKDEAFCRAGLLPVTPFMSIQVIKDLKGSDYSWSYQTPPSSPSSSSSRKSSMCRSVGG